MANYEDYQLEDMENDAVNKSNNWKKAAVVGAAVLGVGGTAAYGASKIMDGQTEPLNADDMMSMAEAGEITDEVVDQPAPQVQEVHNHTHVEVKPAPEVPAEPEISIDETGVVFDEDGNYVGMFDAGTIDGKEFAVYDSDGNGRADILAYDENGNGVFENHEIVSMDNQSYVMGQGQHVQAYVDTPQGLVAVNEVPVTPYPEPIGEDPLSGIHNDFHDEKHNGEPMNDLAHNNPDYNNHDEGNDYNASMEPSMEMDYSEKYDGVAEDTYGADDDYSSNSYDDIANDNLADNTDMGGFDEGADYMA